MDTGSLRPMSAVLLITWDKTAVVFSKPLLPVHAGPEASRARTAEIVDLAAYRRGRFNQHKGTRPLTKSPW